MHLQYDQDETPAIVEHFEPLRGPQGPQGSPMLIEGLTGSSGPSKSGEEEWFWVVPVLDIKLNATMTALLVGGLITFILMIYFMLRPKSLELPGPRPLNQAEALMSRQMSMEALSRRSPAARMGRQRKMSPKKAPNAPKAPKAPKAPAKKMSPKKGGGAPKKIIVEM